MPPWAMRVQRAGYRVPGQLLTRVGVVTEEAPDGHHSAWLSVVSLVYPTGVVS